MKKALVVATVAGFVASFEKSDIKILQSMGYEVHCAANTLINNHPEEFEQMVKDGLISHHIDFARSPFSKNNIKAFRQLNQLMQNEKYDLVHCHTPVGGVIGRIIGHKNNVRTIIYSAHGFHFFHGAPLRNWLLFYPIEKWLSKYTDSLITINSDDYMLAQKKFCAKQTHRIYGVGIDIEQFSANSENKESKREELGVSDDEIMLLTVGELSANKNQKVVLDALKILQSTGDKKYTFFIAGRGEEQERLVEYAKKLGIEDSFVLLGYRNDVPELLAACDMYIFPSKREGISVALMEAIAAEKVVICSKVRGNIDLVTSDEYMFKFDSPKQLADRIVMASSVDNSSSIKMNHENLKKFSISNVQKQMRDIYSFYTND